MVLYKFFSWFYTCTCIYPQGRGWQLLRDKLFMSTGTSCHFSHMLQVSKYLLEVWLYTINVQARGWGISDIMSTGIVWLRCVLYRQQYVLPKCKSLLKLKCTVGHVSCNWICIALHSVLVLVANPTSPTTTTEWSKDDSTMQHAKRAVK